MRRENGLFVAHVFALQLAARRRARKNETADGLRVSEAHDPSAISDDHESRRRVHGTPEPARLQIGEV